MNRKLRVKNLCCNIFVVFLKCALEKGLGGFQHYCVYHGLITSRDERADPVALRAEECDGTMMKLKFLSNGEDGQLIAPRGFLANYYLESMGSSVKTS